MQFLTVVKHFRCKYEWNPHQRKEAFTILPHVISTRSHPTAPFTTEPLTGCLTAPPDGNSNHLPV